MSQQHEASDQETPFLQLVPPSLLEAEEEQQAVSPIPDLPEIGILTAYLTRLQTKRQAMEQALANVQDVQRDFAGWEPCEERSCQEAVKTVEAFKQATRACRDMIIKEMGAEAYPLVMGWLHIWIRKPFFQVEEQADEVSMHLIEYRTICTLRKAADLRVRKSLQQLLDTLVTTGETVIKSLVALNRDAYSEHQRFYQEMHKSQTKTERKGQK